LFTDKVSQFPIVVILMSIAKSAGFIVFRRENDRLYYLLLHYTSGHWDFPKGAIEKGETLEETAKRELREETGIKNVKIIPGFKEWIKYYFKWKGETVMKIVTFLLGETKTKKIEISFEHQGYKWLTFRDALEQLTFKNAKEVLEKANSFLLSNFQNHK